MREEISRTRSIYCSRVLSTVVIFVVVFGGLAAIKMPSTSAHPHNVAFVVGNPSSLSFWENSIYSSISANHTVTLIDNNDVAVTDFSGYEVILESGSHLQPYIRDFVTYKGYNVVAIQYGLQDISSVYGGLFEENPGADTTIEISHPVTAGFAVGNNAVISYWRTELSNLPPFMTRLDSLGIIWAGESNGRLVGIGAYWTIYTDGLAIIDNAIEWASGGAGIAQSPPYSGNIAYIVGNPSSLSGWERDIKDRLSQDGYTITLIDNNNVATTDFSIFDIIVEAESYLQPYIRDLVTYKGHNVVAIEYGLQDISSVYGGYFDYYPGASTTIEVSHPVTAGFAVGNNAVISYWRTELSNLPPSMTRLDSLGCIWADEPNGRLVGLGAYWSIYPDGYTIMENAIEWASGGTGIAQSPPYSGNIAYIVESPSFLYSWESSIRDRLNQDGYAITLIDNDDVATTDFSSYDVIVEPEGYLQPHIRDLVTYQGHNVVVIEYGVQDVSRVYGGYISPSAQTANTTIEVSHPVTAGFTVGNNAILSADRIGLNNPPAFMTKLDSLGLIWAGEPNGRLACIGADNWMYADGFTIIENAIEWASGGVGITQAKLHSKDIGYIVAVPSFINDWESLIKDRLSQDGYNITIIDNDDIATTDFSSFDVIVEPDNYLGLYLPTFVNTFAYNVVAIEDGLNDISDGYGGTFSWSLSEADAEINVSHPVTAGFDKGEIAALSSDSARLSGAPSSFTLLDLQGHILVGQPNGRLAGIGARYAVYPDGFRIIENAIEWASGWNGNVLPGYFSVSAAPFNTTQNIGGNASYTVTLNSYESVPDTFTIDVLGIDPTWWTLSDDQPTLVPGEKMEISLHISIPDDPAAAGFYNIEIRAFSDSFSTNESSSVNLVVIVDPIISDIYPLDGMKMGTTNVLFSWRTSTSSSTEVWLKKATDSLFTQYIGQAGSFHTLNVSYLERNNWYDFYVASISAHGVSASEQRSFYIDNGITYDQRQYEFWIDRDYNQLETIRVTNTDSKPHRVSVSLENPHDDLVVGFVGNGSQDNIISIATGQSATLLIAFHAQDSLQLEYQLLANLCSMPTDIPGEAIFDSAIIIVHINYVDANFTITEIGNDPATLTKTIRIQNHGDILTDIDAWLSDELKGRVVFNPQVDHALLVQNGYIEFNLVPILFFGFERINGTLFAQGYTKIANLSVNFTLPDGSDIFYGNADWSTKRTTRSTFCTNMLDGDGHQMPIGDTPQEANFIDRIKKCLRDLAYDQFVPDPMDILLDDWKPPPLKEINKFQPLGNYFKCLKAVMNDVTNYMDKHMDAALDPMRGASLRPSVAPYYADLAENSAEHPSLVQSNSTIHMVYHLRIDNKTEIFYLKLDMNEDWQVSEAGIFDVSNSTGTSQWPAISFFNSTVHVVWVDNSSGDQEIYYRRGTENGTIWSEDPVQLTNSIGDVDDPNIVVDSQGTVHIVWEDFRTGDSEVYYINSTDGGTSWNPEQNLSANPGNSSYPSISTDSNDAIHVIWEDYRNGFGEIYYLNSTDSGVSWSPGRLVSTGGIDAGEPSLHIDKNDVIHAVWRDSRHGESEIYYRNSTDGGMNWGLELRMTNDTSYSEYPMILPGLNNTLRLIWHDNSTGDDRRYYRDGNTWSEIKRIPSRIPNVLHVFLELEFSIPTMQYYLAEYDGFYIGVNEHEIVTLSDILPKGTYIFPVDPSYLNYGYGIAAPNRLLMRIGSMNPGHFIFSMDRSFILHLSDVDLPVVAMNQSHADSITKSMTTGTWQGVDPAVYANELNVSNPSPTEGDDVIINSTIRNLGEEDVSNVVVQFFDGDPDAGGIQIGSDITIPSIASYGSELANTTWTATQGIHEIYVVLDRADSIVETDEDNNVAIAMLHVLSTIPPAGSIVINSGDAITGTQGVYFDLQASYSNPPLEMSFSNNNVTWSDWEFFVTSRAWSLSPGDGLKAVYVKYRDGAGLVSPVYSDDITLDTTPPTGSILINGGDMYTNSETVILTLSASDAISGVYQMCFSNFSVSWSDWEDYATTKTWILPPGDAPKSVYVRFRDNMLHESTYSDSIILDTTAPNVIHSAPLGSGIVAQTKINVTFSEAMDTASVESSFSITPTVAGTFSWNGNNLTFTPNSNLAMGQKYNITIGTGTKDLAGNALSSAYNWEFTIEQDTDSDGIPDSSDPDDDNDGIPDEWEEEHGLDSKNPADASEDPDDDKLTNLEEYQAGTDPSNPDTDGDGVNDGDDTNPTDPAITGIEGGQDNLWLYIIIAILIVAVIVGVILFMKMRGPKPPDTSVDEPPEGQQAPHPVTQETIGEAQPPPPEEPGEAPPPPP